MKFNLTSVFDLFIPENTKEQILNGSKVAGRQFRFFIIFFLVFSFIPVLLFFKAKDVYNKFFFNDSETYVGVVEFVETSKLGASNTVIPSAEGLLSLSSSFKGGQKGDDIVSRIIKSDQVLKEALFTKVDTTLIINEAVRELLPNSDAYFPLSIKNVNLEDLSEGQRKAYKSIKRIVEDPENEFYYFESNETKKIRVKTGNPILCNELPNALFVSLENFYFKKQSKSKRETNDLIVKKKEQALNDIRSIQNQLSNLRAKRGLTVSAAIKNKERELQGQLMIAQQLYAETTKQLEEMKIISSTSNESKFKLLSKPISPLEPITINNEKKMFTYQIIGAAIGVVVIFIFYILFQLGLFFINKNND